MARNVCWPIFRAFIQGWNSSGRCRWRSASRRAPARTWCAWSPGFKSRPRGNAGSTSKSLTWPKTASASVPPTFSDWCSGVARANPAPEKPSSSTPVRWRNCKRCCSTARPINETDGTEWGRRRQDFWTPRCENKVTRSKHPRLGENASPSKPEWRCNSAHRWVRWSQSYARTKNRASPGYDSCATTASGAFWPTKWVWVKPFKSWPIAPHSMQRRAPNPFAPP